MSFTFPGTAVQYTINVWQWTPDGVHTDPTIWTPSSSASLWSALSSDLTSIKMNDKSALLFEIRVPYKSNPDNLYTAYTYGGLLLGDIGDGIEVTSTLGPVNQDTQGFSGGSHTGGNDVFYVYYVPKPGETSKIITASNFNVYFKYNGNGKAQGLNSGTTPSFPAYITPSSTLPIQITITKAKISTVPFSIIDFLGTYDTASLNPINNNWVVTTHANGIFYVWNFPPPWTDGSSVHYYHTDHTGGVWTQQKFTNQADLATAAKALYIKGSTSTVSANPGGTGKLPPSGTLNTVVYDSQWNPPPHALTKSVSFGDFLASKDFSGDNPAYSGATVTNEYISNQAALTALENTYRSKLGRMIQDTSNLKATNKKTKAPWGFHFMYNPNSISYTSTPDTSIDWTLGKSDPSTALGGNITVSFQLYLNRIIDVRDFTRNGVSAVGSAYPGYSGSNTKAANGILTRGTEYDLEYLYRVLNGDPIKGDVLLADGGETSDIGYITYIPFWLRIHDNMTYFGSISSLSVNHLIFTPILVPVFSTVDISFSRYPAIGNQGVSKTTWDNKINGIVPAIKNTVKGQ